MDDGVLVLLSCIHPARAAIIHSSLHPAVLCLPAVRSTAADAALVQMFLSAGA